MLIYRRFLVVILVLVASLSASVVSAQSSTPTPTLTPTATPDVSFCEFDPGYNSGVTGLYPTLLTGPFHWNFPLTDTGGVGSSAHILILILKILIVQARTTSFFNKCGGQPGTVDQCQLPKNRSTAP